MGQRAHRVLNDDGTSTIIVSRISEAGFADWLRDRAELRAQGFPDRPPDVDTPTLRTWVPHPGEEDLPYFASWSERRPFLSPEVETFPVYMAKWHGIPLTVRITLSGRTTGGYAVELLAAGPEVGTFAWPAGSQSVSPDTIRWTKTYFEKTDERVWDSVERKVTMINENHVWGPDEPAVTTYFDIVDLEAEIDLAIAEAAGDVAWPLPEARA